MKKLQAGKTYGGRFISNYDSTFEVTVTRRTAKTVFFNHPNSGEPKKAKIHEYNDCEYFMPFGNYSMSPTVDAA